MHVRISRSPDHRAPGSPSGRTGYGRGGGSSGAGRRVWGIPMTAATAREVPGDKKASDTPTPGAETIDGQGDAGGQCSGIRDVWQSCATEHSVPAETMLAKSETHAGARASSAAAIARASSPDIGSAHAPATVR